MWNKISSISFFDQMVVGNFITQFPLDLLDQYKITFTALVYVKALHIKEKELEKVFHLEELINDNWWVRCVILN